MNMMVSPPEIFSWTASVEDALRQMVEKGYTSTQICGKLGTTRNAVIGKCKRLGLILGRDRAKWKNPRFSFKWTDEASEVLRELCALNMTSHEISTELVARFGLPISIHAVWQRARLLGISVGGGRQVQAMRARLRGKSAKAVEFKPIAVEPSFQCRRVPLTELAGRACRFPLGDPLEDDFVFCGNDATAGKSYCAGHAALCYRSA
jgi:GcrA cell cycle regulator